MTCIVYCKFCTGGRRKITLPSGEVRRVQGYGLPDHLDAKRKYLQYAVFPATATGDPRDGPMTAAEHISVISKANDEAGHVAKKVRWANG